MIYRNCVLCGKNNSKFLFEKDKLKHLKCKTCGMVYCSPIVNDQELIEHYKSDDHWKKKVLDRKEMKRKKKISEKHFKFLKKHLKKDFSFLDVGCGSGDFLRTLQKKGFKNLQGVEPNKEMQKYIKQNLGIKISNDIEDLQNKKFDVISSVKVLEHLENPEQVINKCYKLLEDKGLLFLVFPQYSSLSKKLLRKDFYGFQSEHINWFNKKTIKKFLEKQKFKIIRIETEHIDVYPIVTGLFRLNRNKNISYTSKKPAKKQNKFLKGHLKKPFSFFFYEIFRPVINKAVCFFGVGDYIVLLARKNEKSKN